MSFLLSSHLPTIASVYLVIFGVELLVLYPLFACFKWMLMSYIGMTKGDRTLVFSNRTRYFDLDYFVERYGDQRLRVVDGLSRKLLHIVAGFWQLMILHLVVKDTEAALIATLTYQIFVLMLSSISYRSNKILGLAGVMYGASSRIRDGIYGRKNLFAARCAFLNLIPLALIDHIARNSVADPSTLVVFSFFVFLPLTIGDAMGEVVGSTWGKQKLKVWGIGEINRKSVLGTAAVFFGSLVPLLLVDAFNQLPWPWWLLALAVSTLTTLIELFAPRGTDNFFIPVGNATVCLTFVFCFLA
ncbi:MAG: hypothetical protein AAFO06_16045 [Cyanobacteria bacterium J06597_16]